jgi:hypothetical protein
MAIQQKPISTQDFEEASKTAQVGGTFWGSDHLLEPLRLIVSSLIPAKGPVLDENSPKLERLRLVTNAYYDLFTNGGWNSERKVSYYFPGAMTKFNGLYGTLDEEASKNAVYEITEPIMAKAVFAAALEQGVI